MLVVGVGVKRRAERIDRFGIDFAERMGNRDHFVAARLDGAGFVGCDMPRIRR